ncbi:MAG: DNA translocase FtsK [Ruminococcaceae bacterium]|nr:DNA translocase FtsK [Oscillospiraceae bacterium]
MKNKKTTNEKTGVKTGRSSGSAVSKKSREYYIAPLILPVVAILIETLLIFESGAGIVGEFASKIILGVCGAAGYVVPIGLLVIAFFYGELKTNKSLKFKYITLACFAVFFAAAQAAFSGSDLANIAIADYFSDTAVNRAGGVVGGGAAKLLAMAAGATGAGVISVMLCAISLSFFIGTGALGVWKYVFEAVRERSAVRAPKKKKSVKEQPEEKLPETKSEAPEVPTLAFSASKRSYSTTISDGSKPAREFDSESGYYDADSYREVRKTAVVEETPEEKARAAQKAKNWADYGSDFSGEEEKKTGFSYSDIPAYQQADNPMTAQDKSGVGAVIQTGASASGAPRYSPLESSSVKSTSNKPAASGASYSRGTSSGYKSPNQKEEKPRAYSPFANPLMTREDFLKGNTKPSAPEKKESESEPVAYSPFANPLMSMRAPHTSHSSTPQAYIANNATDKYVDKKAAAEEAKAEEAPKVVDITPIVEIKPVVKTEAEREDIHDDEPLVIFGKSVGNTQMDDEECTYDDGDDDDTADEPAPASPFLSMTSPATSVLGKSIDKPGSENYHSEEPLEEEGGDGEYSFYTYKEKRYPNYVYPKFDLLDPQKPNNTITEEDIIEVQQKLMDKLSRLGVDVSLSGYSIGPSVTRYELTPGDKVKVKNITSLTEDIALGLGSEGVRISSVPGRAVVGVEVPNKKVTVVSLRSLIESKEFMSAKSKITVCVGLTVTGKPVYMDIDDMPHVLIAGQTKSGKSVAINCMLLSLLYRASPDEVQLILIDPKRVELNVYSRLPHLVMPVIDDPQRAAAALRWAVSEMERRYKLLDKMCVRNREEYYELKDENPDFEYLPQIVIVIDELADLMLQVREHVEELINRLAAKARACGIHLLIGTQRPSVDIITGLIKANIPARISFKVSSNSDSRIILGNVGAERLLGKGDMIYHPTGGSQKRVQGAYVDGKEIKRIMNYIVDNNGSARFDPEIIYQLDSEVEKMNKSNKKSSDDEEDGVIDCSDVDFDYLCQAIELSIELQQVATNAIQRRLKIGFNRAANLVDRMEELGFISKRNGSKPRDVLVTWDTYNQWKAANAK